jgi:predicted outer membrane repeat protein
MRVIALVFLGISLGAQAATLRVGLPFSPGCTHSSVQSAIAEAAANGDSSNLIRVASNQSYTDVRAVVNTNKQLTIEGGFDSCTDSISDPAQPTVLNALAGNSLLEVNLTGGSGITLSSLVLQGATGAAAGGALDLRSGTVLLDNVQIRNNQATVGGGVYLSGVGAVPTRLQIGTNARASFIFGNRTTNTVSGLGGAIYCTNNATISYVSGGMTDNLAGSGAGLYLAQNCRLQFDGMQPASPPVIRNNNASLDGGAIFATTAQVSTSNNTRLFIDGNTARTGAAIYAEEAATVDLRYAWIKGNTATGTNASIVSARSPNTRISLRGGPLHLRCESGDFCSQLHGNGSNKGAIEASNSAQVDLERVHLTGFTSSFASVFAQDASILLSNTLVSGNQNTVGLFQAFNNAQVRLHYSTVVDNTLPAVFVNSNFASPPGIVELYASVVFNTGSLLAPASNFLTFTNGSCRAVVNENANADGVGRVVLNAGLDASYVPTLFGAAIDNCETDALHLTDMLSNPRPFDAPIANLIGPSDLGAFERQPEPPIFRNGFE